MFFMWSVFRFWSSISLCKIEGPKMKYEVFNYVKCPCVLEKCLNAIVWIVIVIVLILYLKEIETSCATYYQMHHGQGKFHKMQPQFLEPRT